MNWYNIVVYSLIFILTIIIWYFLIFCVDWISEWLILKTI